VVPKDASELPKDGMLNKIDNVRTKKKTAKDRNHDFLISSSRSEMGAFPTSLVANSDVADIPLTDGSFLSLLFLLE
jgi:hypothetical protein